MQYIIYLLLFSLILSQRSNIRFETINSDNGLSNNSVYAIGQDGKGFLWIGTQDGLNRFDGINFEVFKKNPFDSLSIQDNWAQVIKPDKAGNIWVGTHNGGLVFFDIYKEKIANYLYEKNNPNSISHNRVWDILVEDETSMWIGTLNGLNKLDIRTGHFSYYKTKSDTTELGQYSVNSIKQLSEDQLILGVWGKSLMIFDKKSETLSDFDTVMQSKNLLKSNYVKDILVNEDDIWIATYGGGLARYSKKSRTYHHYNFSFINDSTISSDLLWSLYIDSKNNFWITTRGGGLNRYNKRTDSFERFTHNDLDIYSFNHSHATVIYEDKSGLLWFGTAGNGLNKFNNRTEKFVFIDKSQNDDLLTNNIEEISYIGQNKFLMGTYDKGLLFFDRNNFTFKHYMRNNSKKNQVLSNTVWEIVSIDKENYLVGTTNGLNHYNIKTGHFKKINFAKKNVPRIYPNISEIIKINKDQYWIGTWGGGLYRADIKKLSYEKFGEFDPDERRIPSNYISALFLDRSKNLWVGSVDKGLFRILRNSETIEHFTHDPKNRNSLGGVYVRSIVEQANGRIWVGTYDGGLNLFLPVNNSFKHFSLENGFPSNTITSLTFDNKQYLWIGTDKGLIQFSPINHRIRTFDQSNGLQGNQFNSASIFIEETNELIFFGSKGFNIFNPDSIESNNFVPPIAVTAYRQFDKIPLSDYLMFNGQETIYLKPDQNYIAFEFSALDYHNPNKNQYQFTMENLTDTWIDAGNRRYVSYSYLEPGQYIFKVRASNNEGKWNMEGKSVMIIVEAPFYMKWWFQLSALIFVFFIIFTIYQNRINQIKELEQTRYKIAQDLHDEIGGTLSSISYFAEAVDIIQNQENKDKNKINKLLKSIKNSALSAQEAIGDIIWSISPKNDKWETLISRMQRYAVDLFDSKQIKYNLNLEQSKEIYSLDMDRRQHLWRIYKEIITNIAKHSDCTSAQVELKINQKRIFLEISDDGKGFDINGETNRNGIKNIKSRVLNLNGSVFIKSNINEGTTWKLEFVV